MVTALPRKKSSRLWRAKWVAAEEEALADLVVADAVVLVVMTASVAANGHVDPRLNRSVE